jgi:cellulose synthase/poly-beta-1,6-N-acetylglucosamine synthase-like glycosyltransferase
MLVVSSVTVVAIVVVLLAVQLAWGWRFVRQFSSQPLYAVHDDQLPRVLVILPVRGADPSLEACLRGLSKQDYPRYDIRVIVDSREDPAWNVVHDILGQHRNPCIQVSALQKRRDTCGLKSSALLQAISTVEESSEVVALIDADVIPHRSWLRDLITPLTNPRVGATTGIRWFMPETATWGSLVRYVWNVAASVQMYALHIPWGGSLALRMHVLRGSDLLQKWGLSLWEDTASYRTIRELGLQLEFVPAATMVNRETTDLKSCFRFIRRQMLNVRLYHGSWRTILAHGAASALALGITLILAAIALPARDGPAAAVLLGGLVFHVTTLATACHWVERHVHRLTRTRGEEIAPLSLKMFCAVPLTHVVYFASLVSARTLAKVSWRGITYDFKGPWAVRMRKYRPYSTRKARDRRASVV